MIYLLTIIIIFGTECFGFGGDTEVIRLTGVGNLNFGHILIIIAYILSFIKWKPKRIQIKDSILLPLFLLILLIFFQAGRNLIIDGIGFKSIIGELKTLYMLFFIVPLIMLIKNKNELYKFINILLILGVINSLICIYQFITATILPFSKVELFKGFYRVYHPNAFFIAICVFISFSFYLNFGIKRVYLWKYLFIPIYILAILTTLHRSLIIISFIGIVTIFSIYTLSKSTIRVVVKQLTFFILLLIIIIYSLNIIGLGSEPLSYRLGTSYEDTRYFGGTVEKRYIQLLYQLSSIRGNYLLGLGFQYNPEISDSYYDPMALCADIMYGNIMLFFRYQRSCYFCFFIL